MPRFTMRSMLLVVAVAALWLSTIVVYPGNDDVRHAIVLLGVVATGVQIYCSTGRQKCFWLAFFLVFIVAVACQVMIFPTMQWVSYSVRPFITSIDIYSHIDRPGPGEQQVEFVADTIKLASDLILASVAGTIGLDVYDRNRSANAN